MRVRCARGKAVGGWPGELNVILLALKAPLFQKQPRKRETLRSTSPGFTSRRNTRRFQRVITVELEWGTGAGAGLASPSRWLHVASNSTVLSLTRTVLRWFTSGCSGGMTKEKQPSPSWPRNQAVSGCKSALSWRGGRGRGRGRAYSRITEREIDVATEAVQVSEVAKRRNHRSITIFEVSDGLQKSLES
jgi:hypothetical protein